MWDLIIANFTGFAYGDRVTVAYAPWGFNRTTGYPVCDAAHPTASGYIELGQGLAFALNNLL